MEGLQLWNQSLLSFIEILRHLIIIFVNMELQCALTIVPLYTTLYPLLVTYLPTLPTTPKVHTLQTSQTIYTLILFTYRPILLIEFS